MNSLALTIINDGNGDQCGYSYQERLIVARHDNGARFGGRWVQPSELSWTHMVAAAEQWHRGHGGEPHSITYEQEAVDEIRAYYRRHLEELKEG